MALIIQECQERERQSDVKGIQRERERRTDAEIEKGGEEEGRGRDKEHKRLKKK